MTRSLATQLRDAWMSSGMRLDELRERANEVARSLDRRDDTFTMSLESLSRKLAGKQIMTTHECELLAQTLIVNLVWTPEPVRSAPQRARRAS